MTLERVMLIVVLSVISYALIIYACIQRRERALCFINNSVHPQEFFPSEHLYVGNIHTTTYTETIHCQDIISGGEAAQVNVIQIQLIHKNLLLIYTVISDLMSQLNDDRE